MVKGNITINQIHKHNLSMQLLNKFENFTISFDEKVPGIICTALGHPKSSEYLHSVFKQVIKTCEEYGLKYENLTVLMDFQHAGGATSEDTEWVSTYVNPKLANAGVKKLAVLNPVEEYARISIQEYMELPPSGDMKLRLFGDHNSAMQWLREVN